jgi:peptide/nickel transport system permease protein
MMRNPLPISLIIGAILTSVFVASAIITLFYVPFDPAILDIGGRFQPPSLIHWFGTDHLGRDVFSMVAVGAQTSIVVAILSVSIGMGIGVPLGLLAAAKGGLIEELVMRGNDVVFAFPAILMAILIAAIMGPGAFNIILAVGIFNIPVFAQLTRGSARVLWQREFVMSAQIINKGRFRISVEHILPNIVNLIVVQATIQFSLAIAAEAALSYIGLGTQPPAPSWGRMLSESQTMFGWASWLSIFPGLAILLAVFGLTLLGDGLRKVLDPRAINRG